MGLMAVASGTIGSVSIGLPSLVLGDDGEGSGPVDCGPPPQAKPQHRTGGESFPPLPLPATPLRRTEKKRPPAPPPLIGKMALGPVRWVTKDGKRTQYPRLDDRSGRRRHAAELDGGEAGDQLPATEADFDHFSFDPRELPALALRRPQHVRLDRQRPRRSWPATSLDGGTIIGDACCGWKDFADSFRREMEAIFPDRPLRKMLPDDPSILPTTSWASFTYKKGDGSTYTADPCLESIDFGCRSGVIFSPSDLTCGWDGHEHPRGKRVVIEQARQIGANMITYVLGSLPARPVPQHDEGLLRGRRARRGTISFSPRSVHEGDWDPDPSAVHNLLKYVRDNSTLEVKFKRESVRLPTRRR